VEIIDEIPHQFQKRDVLFKTALTSRQHKLLNYLLRPTKRGEYEFGWLRVYVQSPLKLVSRRFNFEQAETLPVYPSFLQMRKYELMAISNRLNEIGIKKIRRLGHSMEFEQIKNYVAGDDYRTLNWKATIYLSIKAVQPIQKPTPAHHPAKGKRTTAKIALPCSPNP